MRQTIRSLFLALAVLAYATSALAQQKWAHVHPFGPTSATPVEVHVMVTCPSIEAGVTRVGNVIRVRLRQEEQCILPVVLPSVVKAPVGELLPPGTYRVEVRSSDDALFAETELVVRNAGPKPFEIHPFAVPVDDDAALQMRMTGVHCGVSDCSDVTVRVGDTIVSAVQARNDGSIQFTAPAHAKGLVDVRVQTGDAVQVSPGALYYFELPDAIPDVERSVFERILFPVLDRANGAHGSRWVSEAVISNPRPWHVLSASSIIPIECIRYPCGELLFPGQTVQFEGRNYPHGAILFAPRPEAPDLALALRVRDVSRQAEGFGTRVPVVREAEMFHGRTMTLLDVPLDPRYRVKLRIYAVEPFENMLVGSLKIVRGEHADTIPFEMEPPDGEVPAYFEIDLPAGVAGERAHLFIEPPLDATAWAFATITNNDTQQVTIVTPE